MATNLKSILGLSEPSAGGAACQQAKAFRKAFQAAIKEIGGWLEFTAAHAAHERHRALAEKRDKAYSAYQAAAKKIDPANPAAAENAIKRVGTSVDKLRGGAETLHDYAAEHHAAWIESGESFEAATEQVTQMVEWGYPSGDKLQQVVDAIDGQAKLRNYKEAVEALKKFLEKLKLAYEDFTAQREARIEYDQLHEDNRQTLDKFAEATECSLLSDWRAEIQGNLDGIEISVEAQDYVTALADLEAELTVIEDYLKEHAYETALEELQPKINRVRAAYDHTTVGGAVSASVLWLALESMKQLAASGDFEQALQKLNELAPALDAEIQKLDKVKYEAAADAHYTTLSNAFLTSHRNDDGLKKWKDAYLASRKSLDALVAEEAWREALSKLDAVVEDAQQFIDQDAAYGTLSGLRTANPADDAWFDNFGTNVPPDPIWNEELLIFRSYRKHFLQGDFINALKDWRAFFAIREDLKIRVQASDADAVPKAAAAADKIRKLSGVEDLTSLDEAGMNKLVKKLEKLPQKKLRQMWKDLLMPSTPLGAQEQVMQAALFDAMKVDKQFKKAEGKLRAEYEQQLRDDPELQEAIKNWDARDPRNNPIVDEATKKEMIQRAIAAQSEAYGIDVPEIDWDPNQVWGRAEFSEHTNQITINPETLEGARASKPGSSEPEQFVSGSNSIALMLHENAHNYQDELVNQYLRGELSQDDPMYEQAELFAFNNDDGYLSLDADFDEQDYSFYSQQPGENHSYAVQESAVEALIEREE